MQSYQTLADLYAAILKGEVDPKTLFAQADSSEFTVYGPDLEHLYRGYEFEAIEFVAQLLGVPYRHP